MNTSVKSEKWIDFYLLDDCHPDVLAERQVEDWIDDRVHEGQEEAEDSEPVDGGGEEHLQVQLQQELQHEARAPAHQKEQHHPDQHLDHLKCTVSIRCYCLLCKMV